MVSKPRFLLRDIYRINDSEQFHQAIQVFRLKIGDEILGVSNGEEYLLQIEAIDHKDHTIELNPIIQTADREHRELPFHIKLLIPLLKGDRTELVLQKCTELGAQEFQFISYEHSVKQAHKWDNKLLRWQKIIHEAVEQSERTVIPCLNRPMKLEECLHETRNKGYYAFVARDGERHSQEKLLAHHHTELNLIFGPEGGFSDRELSSLRDRGVEFLSLGRRILRAETAIIVGCGLASLHQ